MCNDGFSALRQLITRGLPYMTVSAEKSTQVRTSSRSKKLFCRSCFRKDRHMPVRPNILLVTLSICTLGVFARWFWPYRCRTCGTKRTAFPLPF
jgi:hypothetical protein